MQTKVQTPSEQMLESFKLQGYDRIHISGGTSLDGSHYSGIIGYNYDAQNKKFEFVGLPYNSKAHKNDQSNSHTKRAGESETDTAIREFFEETGLKANSEDLDLIHFDEIPDNRPEKSGQTHKKFYYMVNIARCSGTLSDFQGPNPIDQETLAPVLFEAELFVRKVFKGHLEATRKAIEKLKAKSADFYYALANL